MQLPVEIAPRPYLHVRSHPGSTKSSVSRMPPPEMLWGFIRENDHQVIIAVWAGISACRRTEQVNPERVIDLGQAPDNLAQHRVAGGRRLEGLDLGLQHVPWSQFATFLAKTAGAGFPECRWSHFLTLRDSAAASGGLPVVVLEQPAEALFTAKGPIAATDPLFFRGEQ